MRHLLALMLFVPSLCLAQLPNYVPAEGLVAWYPLDGNASDLSGLGHHGIVNGPMSSMDRFGNPNGAYYFNDASSISANLQGVGNGNVPVTISSWVHIEQTSTDVSYVAGVGDAPYVSEGTVFGMGEYGGSGLFATMSGSQFDAISGTAIPLDQWVMLTAVHEGDGSVKLYVDSTEIFSFQGSTPNIQFDVALIGTAPWGGSFWSGDIDEVGIWSRALTEEEVQAMFLGAPIEFGCTDSNACNFNENALSDDGSCVPCEVLAQACGEGTLWDSTLQQCISNAPPCAASCGEGTVWDPVNEECIVAIPADINFDGCVTVNDLLELLAVHGTCPPYPEWPDEPDDTTWACGNPLTYWDYDYATVLIGEQCWFAENLRTVKYAAGAEVPLITDNDEWSNLSTGACSLYGNSDSYGLLYNGYAVESSMNLCPDSWHVPLAQDWSELESYASTQGFGGNEGTALKFTYGWNGNGNGTNDFGFSGQPGGLRNPANGSFANGGWYGYWWSSTMSENGRLFRFLGSSNPMIEESYSVPQNGFSVRCIKD